MIDITIVNIKNEARLINLEVQCKTIITCEMIQYELLPQYNLSETFFALKK